MSSFQNIISNSIKPNPRNMPLSVNPNKANATEPTASMYMHHLVQKPYLRQQGMESSYQEMFDQYSKPQQPKNMLFSKSYLAQVDHYRQSKESSSLNPGYFQNYVVGGCEQVSTQNYYLPLLQGDLFPVSFNPRASPNMPHKEKVNQWITDVPVYCYQDIDGEDLWTSECYPAVIPISSGSTISDFLDDDMDDSNSQDLFVDKEDVVEFQSRKITEYVRRLYNLDQSDLVVKGSSTLDDDYDKLTTGQTGDNHDLGQGYVEHSFKEGDLQGDLNLEFFESEQFQAALAGAVGNASKQLVPGQKKRLRQGNL